MRILLCPLAVVLGCLSLLWEVRPVHACTPPPPGLFGSQPASGANLPANAAIRLMGYALALDDVTATINTTATTLVTVPGYSFGELWVKTATQPAVGDTITLSGTFCEPAYNCTAHTLTFTAIAADTSTPVVPALEVNLHDHADVSGGIGSCTPDTAATWWFTLSGDNPGAADAIAYHVVEVARDATFNTVFRTVARFADQPSVDTRMWLNTPDFSGSPVEAFCFRAFTVDAAGQRSANTAVTCRPCHARVDPQVDAGIGSFPPDQPNWTPADVVGNGPCDPGTSSSGGGSSVGPSSASGPRSSSGVATSQAPSSGGGSSAGNSSSTITVSSSTAASADAGPKDVDVNPGPGCNCRTVDDAPVAWLLGAVVLGGWARRRRRTG